MVKMISIVNPIKINECEWKTDHPKQSWRQRLIREAMLDMSSCRHGKKDKVWEGDGYLTLVDRMAHLCDLRGRMLEEPTLLDEVDHGCVVDLGELVIGNHEVQVIELDK